MTDLMQHVPVGSQNAKRSYDIHAMRLVGAESSTSKQLNRLAEQGIIKRRKQQLRCSNNFMWLYWREA